MPRKQFFWQVIVPLSILLGLDYGLKNFTEAETQAQWAPVMLLLYVIAMVYVVVRVLLPRSE